MRARFALLIVLGLASVADSGCYYRVTQEPLPEADRSAAAVPGPKPYTVRIFDQLGVKFYLNPDLNEDVWVRPDGKISLQLVGDIDAVGLEPAVLASRIEDAYRSELSTPRVSVLVRKFGGRVYVGGEVKSPGQVPLVEKLTLVQAIQEAGGFLPGAHLSQVVLIRRDENGKPVGYAVDVRPVIGGTDAGQDVPLQPYDIAFVPRSKIADMGLFVQQYIRDMLPVEFALPIF